MAWVKMEPGLCGDRQVVLPRDRWGKYIWWFLSRFGRFLLASLGERNFTNTDRLIKNWISRSTYGSGTFALSWWILCRRPPTTSYCVTTAWQFLNPKNRESRSDGSSSKSSFTIDGFLATKPFYMIITETLREQISPKKIVFRLAWQLRDTTFIFHNFEYAWTLGAEIHADFLFCANMLEFRTMYSNSDR